MFNYQIFKITQGGGTLKVQVVTSSSRMIMKSPIPCEKLSKIFRN